MEIKNLRYGNDYPSQCPPADCYQVENKKMYRVCSKEILNKNNNLNMENFIPVWEDKKRRFPKKKRCEAKALSFFLTKEDCLSIISDFPKIGNKIIEVTINKKCGYLKKTANRENHYSLWDLSTPTISQAVGNNWELVYEKK
ncbi:hypothetical protein [Lactobacillus apis]|uniref:hypothetical protein n=1 Tax=Lactobacillus apis TaxID=303541 RepID=UPI00164F02D9|nr:hypothetical protein [Lactobacillus apis]MBC6361016.1 hypothetical protein [Lactobacillus apis]